MIEVKITRSENGIYTSHYPVGWNMQLDKDKCINQAKRILMKLGYTEDEIIIIEEKYDE